MLLLCTVCYIVCISVATKLSISKIKSQTILEIMVDKFKVAALGTTKFLPIRTLALNVLANLVLVRQWMHHF
jgi:hypothetical protein